LVSCGGALLLARLGLTARGWQVEVDRLPDPADRDLLARIRVVGPHQPDEATRAEVAAAERRHTERRPFRTDPVPADLLDRLSHAATSDGVYAHVASRPDERLDLAVIMSGADRLDSIEGQPVAVE